MFNDDDNFLEMLEDDNDDQLFIEEPRKEKFFDKVLNLIAKNKGHSIGEIEPIDYSVFEHIANSSDINDVTQENQLRIREAVDLSEEAIKLFRQKLIYINRSKVTDDKMSKIEIFKKLDAKEVEYLKMILNRYQSIIKERNVVDAQLTSFNKNVIHINTVLAEATEYLPKIVEGEKTYRIFKQDINHIEGEKEELLEEMETLIIGRDFFKKFSFIFIILSVLFSIVLSFLGIFYNVDIFMQLFILIITIMVVATGLYYVRSKISTRMKLNIAYQKRAVELLNKKNAVFAYYTNFLNFEYKKYRVTSSHELRQNLKEVKFYNQALKRADNVRNVIRESEIEIFEFLEEHDIKLNTSLLRFAQSFNIEEQQRNFYNLREEKDKLDIILEELEQKYELVISRLMDLSEHDTTKNKVINEIVSALYVETNKIVLEFE